MSRSPAPGWTCCALALAALLSGCAQPAPQSAPNTAPPAAVLEDEASAALRRMAATLTAAQSFTLRFTTLREAPAGPGQSLLLGGAAAIAIRRPDRLYASVGSDLGSFNRDGSGNSDRSITGFPA